MTKFRSGKRKDGSRYSFPISERQASHSQPLIEKVKFNIRKIKTYGRYDQRDIDYAKDVLPDVDEDKDFGWLPALERDLEREFDQQDRTRLAKMFHQIKKGTPEEAAVSLAELEKEYPTVYENYTGKEADVPR
jgi:hypothetical protein